MSGKPGAGRDAGSLSSPAGGGFVAHRRITSLRPDEDDARSAHRCESALGRGGGSRVIAQPVTSAVEMMPDLDRTRDRLYP